MPCPKRQMGTVYYHDVYPWDGWGALLWRRRLGDSREDMIPVTLLVMIPVKILVKIQYR